MGQRITQKSRRRRSLSLHRRPPPAARSWTDARRRSGNVSRRARSEAARRDTPKGKSTHAKPAAGSSATRPRKRQRQLFADSKIVSQHRRRIEASAVFFRYRQTKKKPRSRLFFLAIFKLSAWPKWTLLPQHLPPPSPLSRRRLPSLSRSSCLLFRSRICGKLHR